MDNDMSQYCGFKYFSKCNDICCVCYWYFEIVLWSIGGYN